MKRTANPGFEACSACNICLTSCPAWLSTRDMALTRPGRAKALQGGAALDELADAVNACCLCLACEVICPEEITVDALTLEQRRQLNRSGKAALDQTPIRPEKIGLPDPLLLVDDRLWEDKKVIETIIKALGSGKNSNPAAERIGYVTRSIEAGIPAGDNIKDDLLRKVKAASKVIVSDGLLLRTIINRLPGRKICGLGEALVRARLVQKALGPSDLYVIESRSYHAKHRELARLYDELRRDTGCLTNLDLHRLAISTTASSGTAKYVKNQAGWILMGKKV